MVLDTVNKADEDLPFPGWHLAMLSNKILITPLEDSPEKKKTLRNTSESGKNEGISIFKGKGILRGFHCDACFTIIKKCKPEHSLYSYQLCMYAAYCHTFIGIIIFRSHWQLPITTLKILKISYHLSSF